MQGGMPPSHGRLTLSGARCAGRPAPVRCGRACSGSRCPAELRPPGTSPSPRLCARRSSTR
eukprot:6132586-Pleurochrysis_carterae.AAC.1